MAVIGEAEVRVVPDTRGFGKDVEEQVEAPVTKAAKRMGIALAAAFSAKAVGSFFKDAVAAASAAEEATSKVGVVFGDAADEVEAFASTSAEAFGQSSTQAKQAAGDFGNLFRAIGLTEDKSAEFATTLTGLASDLASFNDVEVDDALLALRSGLVGEAEPLRKFGVSLSAARIEAKALELGLASTKDEVNEAVKAQAAYQIILEDTALAQGDFARTSEGLANSQRTLAAEFAEAKTELGQGLLPLAKELVDASSDLIPLIVELGEVAVPLLTTGFKVAEPFIGTTTALMEALLPIVDFLASGLEALPPPLLQLAALGVGANKALSLVNTGAKGAGDSLRILRLQAGSAQIALKQGGGLGAAAAASGGGLSKLNIAAAGAAVAVGAGVAIYAAATKEGKRYDAAVEDIAESLAEASTNQDTFNDVLQDSLAPLDELNLSELTLLDRLSLEVQDFKDAAAASGVDVLEPLRQSLRDLGVEIEDNATKAQIAAAVYESELQAKYPGFAQEIEEFTNKYEDLDNEIDAGSKLYSIRAAAQDGLTRSQERGIDSAVALAEKTGDWQRAADGIEKILDPAAEKTDDLTDAVDGLTDGLIDTNEELDAYIDNLVKAFGGEVDYEDAVRTTEDALADVVKAEDNLAKARGPAGDLEAAIAAEDFAEAQAELNRVRGDAESTPGDVLKAEQDLADAYGDVIETSQRVAIAEEELAEAERAVTDASLAQAEAAGEVARNQAEAAGRTDTSTAAVRGFTGEIDALADTVSDRLGPGSDALTDIEALGVAADDAADERTLNMVVNTSGARAELDDLKAQIPKEIVVPFRFETGDEFNRRTRIGGIPIFAAEGFYGTVDRATPFLAGEAGTEDVLVVPTAIGGIAKVVEDLASKVGATSQTQSGGGVVISPGAIQVVAGPDSSPQAIAREVIDRLGYELTVRGDA